MKTPNHYIGEFEELVLLAIVSLGKEAYGVRINDAIEEATSRSISLGALYTTLSRLEEKGLISSWMGEATRARGGRAKKYYKIEAPAKLALNRAEQSRRRLVPNFGVNFFFVGEYLQ
jgi:DNA-binding PadR family transcriptional regulator